LEKHLNDRAKAAESPQAKQQLADAAADIRKKVQDLVDAVNKAFADPDNADLSKPLEALREAVEKGREISDKTAPPAPKGLPEALPGGARPKGLHDEIQNAKELAKAIPDIAREDPQHLPDAQDKLKDQVEQIRKKVHPNPDEWRDDIEQPLADQIKAAGPVSRAPNSPAPKKALDDATNQLVKALDDVDARYAGATPRDPYAPGSTNAPRGPQSYGAPQAPGGPNAPRGKGPHDGDGGHRNKPAHLDPETKKKMIDQIKDFAPEIAKAIANPDKKEQFEKAKLKDNLQNLRADVKHHHPKKAAQHTKLAALAAKDLVKALKDDALHPDLSPEDQAVRLEAAEDLENAIPEFIAAARDAMKDFKMTIPLRHVI